MKINKVVIVGGGSSGWMTAAALCKNFPDMEITLIESKDVKTIGVGESTLQQINSFFDILGLEDEDWMSKCDATYKVSIAFTDFRERGFQVSISIWSKWWKTYTTWTRLLANN